MTAHRWIVWRSATSWIARNDSIHKFYKSKSSKIKFDKHQRRAQSSEKLSGLALAGWQRNVYQNDTKK